MIAVRRIESVEPAALHGRCILLQDAVHGGASVGFLAPMATATAERCWGGVFAELARNARLWVAKIDGHVGCGIASMLLEAVEAYARGEDRTLLVLDTETGSPAEEVHRRRGWQYGGSIPDYATTPDGHLHPTSYYFKRLVS
jgi:acetyltransferase